MASAYVRIKVELDNNEAARFVGDKRGYPDGTLVNVSARDVVTEVTAEVMAVLRRSPLHREYRAEISQAPR